MNQEYPGRLHYPVGWLLVGLVLLTVGCQRGPKRHHVSGRILYRGESVPAGEIYFDPDYTKGPDGPQGFARILNGQYDTRKVGKSIASGPHVVRILGFDGKQAPEMPLGRKLFEFVTHAEVADDVTLDFEVPVREQP